VIRFLPGLVLALVVVATGCGGSSSASLGPRVTLEGPIGSGADRYWLYRPRDEPRAVVVYLHGLDESELIPANHRAWLFHLALEGDAVVYPTYETAPGAYGATRHIQLAVAEAMRRLGSPKVPIVAVGYSRGGRLAVEWAAFARRFGRTPAAVMSIFPGRLNAQLEEKVDLRKLDPKTRVAILVGEADDREGARELVRRLARAAFPPERIDAVLVRSSTGFVADHFSVFQTSPAARKAFWARADRLVDAAVRSG
jgi:pimeloyl-ACP methyl ester carboxylesterase